jgi:hypothetical protein
MTCDCDIRPFLCILYFEISGVLVKHEASQEMQMSSSLVVMFLDALHPPLSSSYKKHIMVLYLYEVWKRRHLLQASTAFHFSYTITDLIDLTYKVSANANRIFMTNCPRSSLALRLSSSACNRACSMAGEHSSML